MQVTSIQDLLSSDPVYSKEFEYRKQRLRFKLLDSRDIEHCKVWAQRIVFDSLMTAFDGVDNRIAIVTDLVKTHVPNLDAQQNYEDMLILASSLVNAETKIPIVKSNTPLEVAHEISDMITPMDRRALLDEYMSFLGENDPHRITEEAIEEIISNSKKNALDSLMLAGSSVLRISLLTLLSLDMMPTDPDPLTGKETQEQREEWERQKMAFLAFESKKKNLISQTVKSWVGS